MVATAVNPSPQGIEPPEPDLEQVVEAAWKTVPPLWTLRNFVAVNPYMGFTDRPFADAVHEIDRIYHARVLMPVDYYRAKFRDGEITEADLRATAQPELTSRSSAAPGPEMLQIQTYSEGIDRRHHRAEYAPLIIDELAKWCAARFDLGQAAWRMPWKQLSFWDAWREAASIDHSPEYRGLNGFREYVASLPADPNVAIRHILKALEIPPAQWTDLCARALATIRGWAGHVRYQVREAGMQGRDERALERDFLAVRLAYEGAVHALFGKTARWVDLAEPWLDTPGHADERGSALRWQAAFEASFRRRLVQHFKAVPASEPAAEQPALQAVFCIDVRSEILRRHLESLSPRIQTIGFAGFFGFPIEWTRLGDGAGAPRCPVLISPAARVKEGSIELAQGEADERRFLEHLRHRTFNSARLSSVSSFALAETVGLWFGFRLLTDSVHATHPHPDGGFFGSRLDGQLGPRLEEDPSDASGIALEARIAFAEGAIRGMGIADGFAEVVLLCGHGSRTANNPYGSGLDCGACGGHPGDANARVAVGVLNDPEVRAGLVSRGITIPDNTRFVAGLHETTTDHVELFDAKDLPPEVATRIQGWLAEAGRLTRAERMGGLLSQAQVETKRSPETWNPGAEVKRRSRDWSEVRPEWGLARNAAFVAARRSRTRGIPLDGRVFLHDYDEKKDPQRGVLELIITAPMVVAHWINMQYYASTVDNEVFGSGNKVLHNVVGRHGVMEGNRSDLKPGLPHQSVHNGDALYHEPIRLQVFIEAPTADIDSILARHDGVRALIDNGWLDLCAWEGDQVVRREGAGHWAPVASA